MFFACSQGVGKFSRCILKIVETCFVFLFLFFSFFFSSFLIYKYDRYFSFGSKKIKSNRIKIQTAIYEMPFIREKSFTFYVSLFIKLFFFFFFLFSERRIENREGGMRFRCDSHFPLLFFSPRQTHLAAVVADGEKAQVMAKNKLAQREILALFGLTGEREKFRREFANKGKTIYPANGRSIGRLKIFTRFLPDTAHLADI